MLEEREREIACLTEEKRFYQLELMNRESTYNHLFGVQPIIGVLDPLHHHRKKGLKEQRGQHQSQSTETWSRQVAASSMPPFSTHTTTSQRQDFLVQRSKSVEPTMVHINEPAHGKTAETNSVSANNFHQVMSIVDYISNLFSTAEHSTAEVCRSQSRDAAPRSNQSSTPEQTVDCETREWPKSDTVNSAKVNSDPSPVTNDQTSVTQDCTLTFSAVDVPDSKMSILLQSHESTQKSKIGNFAMRSRSVETAGNKVHATVPNSTSSPSLQ